MDKLQSEIVHLIKSFNASLKKHLPALTLEVQSLIDKKSTDKNTIENTLDTLLSLTMHGFADDIFIKLLEYYKTVNADGALFYWNEYDCDKD